MADKDLKSEAIAEVKEAKPSKTKKAPKKAAKKAQPEPVVETKPAVTEAKAAAKTIRITARKVRLVVDLVRNKDVKEALSILAATPNRAAEPVKKLIISASANAVNNFGMDQEKLYIKEIWANESVTMKRFQPRAKGSASPILKRTSNIDVIVAERA